MYECAWQSILYIAVRFMFDLLDACKNKTESIERKNGKKRASVRLIYSQKADGMLDAEGKTGNEHNNTTWHSMRA